jgi:hypothetical protein
MRHCMHIDHYEFPRSGESSCWCWSQPLRCYCSSLQVRMNRQRRAHPMTRARIWLNRWEDVCCLRTPMYIQKSHNHTQFLYGLFVAVSWLNPSKKYQIRAFPDAPMLRNILSAALAAGDTFSIE